MNKFKITIEVETDNPDMEEHNIDDYIAGLVKDDGEVEVVETHAQQIN